MGLKTTICSGKRIVVYELISKCLGWDMKTWFSQIEYFNILGTRSKGWVEGGVRRGPIIEFIYFPALFLNHHFYFNLPYLYPPPPHPLANPVTILPNQIQTLLLFYLLDRSFKASLLNYNIVAFKQWYQIYNFYLLPIHIGVALSSFIYYIDPPSTPTPPSLSIHYPPHSVYVSMLPEFLLRLIFI